MLHMWIHKYGRPLWRASSPRLLLKAGHVQQVALGHIQLGFEYAQGCSFQNFSGQPVPVFNHPHIANTHTRKKKSYTCMKFPEFKFELVASHPVTCVTEESLVLSSLLLSHQLFRHIHEIPLSHLFSVLNSSSSLYLLEWQVLYPFAFFEVFCSSMSMPLLCWEAQNSTQLSRCGLIIFALLSVLCLMPP